MVERDLLPILIFGEFRKLGEMQRDNEGIAVALEEIGPAPFVATGENDWFHADFRRDLRGAARHQRTAAFEDDRYPLRDGGCKCFEGWIERWTFSAFRVPAIILVVFGVKVGVEHHLADGGDGAH